MVICVGDRKNFKMKGKSMLYKEMKLEFSLKRDTNRSVMVPSYKRKREYIHVKLGECEKVHTFLVDGKDLSGEVLKPRVDQFVEKLVKLKGLNLDKEDLLKSVEVIWKDGKMSVNAVALADAWFRRDYELKDLDPIEFLCGFGVIEKIGVYCYKMTHHCDGGAVVNSRNLILIGNNEEKLERRTEYYHGSDGWGTNYTLHHSAELHGEEIMERFNLSEIDIAAILYGKNLELENTDYFNECKLTIDELRERRRINSEPFDADDLISKISSEYVLTPERKKALLKSINKLP